MERKEFNEPIYIEYKVKSKIFSLLNHFPLIKKTIMVKLPFLGNKIMERKFVVNERIVENPLIFRNLNLKRGKILDVGCFGSRLCIELASLGMEVYGIDNTQEYLIEHPNFKFCKGDICNTGFPNEFFDRIIAVSSIEHIGIGFYGDLKHIEGDKKALREIFRILKTSGKLLLTCPFGKDCITSWYRVYDRDSLTELLRDFRIEKMEFFVSKGGNWFPATEEEAEKIGSSVNDVKSIVFAVALKSN